MARIKYTTRSSTRSKAQNSTRVADPVVANDEQQTKLQEVAEVDDESELLLPEPASAPISKPAGETVPTMSTPRAHAKTTKITKIMLHLPPARVLDHLQILPVDVIMSDMTDANGGIPPLQEDIRARAVSWMKEAYRAGTRMSVVRSAAEQILQRLDTVIEGNPNYMHNRPREKAYERLEVQRKFLRTIICIHCGMLNDLEVFDMIVARD